MKKILQFIIKNISAGALIALGIIAAITGVYAFQSMSTTPSTTGFQSGPAPMLTKTSGTYNRDNMSLQAISEKIARPCSPQPALSTSGYQVFNGTAWSDCTGFICNPGKYYCGIDNTCRDYPSCSAPAIYNLTFRPYHYNPNTVNHAASMLTLRCAQGSYVSSVVTTRTTSGGNGYTDTYFVLDLYGYDLGGNKVKYDTTNRQTNNNYYNNSGVKEINWVNTNKTIGGIGLVGGNSNPPRFGNSQADIYGSTGFGLSNLANYIPNSGWQWYSFNIVISCMPM